MSSAWHVWLPLWPKLFALPFVGGDSVVDVVGFQHGVVSGLGKSNGVAFAIWLVGIDHAGEVGSAAVGVLPDFCGILHHFFNERQG